MHNSFKIECIKRRWGQIYVFFIKNEELLEKYNEIWDKVSNSMKKVFDSEPVYNEKKLKTQITPHEGKINTHFHGNKIPEEVFEFIYLLVTLTNYVFRTGKTIILKCV